MFSDHWDLCFNRIIGLDVIVFDAQECTNATLSNLANVHCECPLKIVCALIHLGSKKDKSEDFPKRETRH